MTFAMRSRGNDGNRQGVAAVELAICLPAIMLLVMGAIEACSMVYLRQSAQTIAYETARSAVTPRTTSATAIGRGQQVVTDRGVRGADIQIEPNDLSTAARGSHVVVTVAVPLAQNRVMRSYFFRDQQLVANVTMMRE
jgi:Flp pilus assembly protein TadG